MRRIRSMSLGLFAAMVALSCDSDDGNGPDEERFTASLTGAAERPTPVSTPATGVANLTWDGTQLTWTVNVTGNLTSNVNNAHIHGPATAEQAVGVIANLGFNAVQTGLVTSGSITAPSNTNVSMDSLLTLMRNGMAYVNVHTGNHIGGEIRGQIARVP